MLNYQESIEFLYARLPMFSRIGAAAIKKDLTNTLELCERLGNPQRQFKSIHIAGTNGKGSSSHMLAAVLQTAGYTTGLYTSPHLHDFRERIRINGIWAEEDFVVAFVEKVKPWLDEIEPSFFEITVAMAFTYFAEKRVDIAVIETGLGGRLDSTNIITPELSVITNIGWDHMNILGDTLEKIASEKAGIIKPGVPVVIGETQPEIREVFVDKARACGANIVFADQQRFVNNWNHHGSLLIAEIADHTHQDHEEYQMDLTGIYQLKNLLTVLEACHQLTLKGWNISRHQLKAALLKVKALTALHGRWEVIHQHPTVVLDVGHNPDGIRQVLAQLEITPHHALHLITGMVRDKDIDKVLALLPKTARYYFTQAQIPRALSADELAAKAASLGLEGEVYLNVNIALQKALSSAGKNDLILVCGSVFLVGEVNRSLLHL
jgi:dihydrofolate synthase / folylpolyglutamate synthase